MLHGREDERARLRALVDDARAGSAGSLLVVGEPGVEATPFTIPMTDGWEDDLSHPRTASELVGALDTTFAVIEGVLDRWTPDMLTLEVRREYAGKVQVHSRASVLQRMFSHEAYHCGELSQTLGIHRLPQIDLWAANV